MYQECHYVGALENPPCNSLSNIFWQFFFEILCLTLFFFVYDLKNVIDKHSLFSKLQRLDRMIAPSEGTYLEKKLDSYF